MDTCAECVKLELLQQEVLPRDGTSTVGKGRRLVALRFVTVLFVVEPVFDMLLALGVAGVI